MRLNLSHGEVWMIVNGLAIDSICPWSRSSPGLKLVLPPRSTDFFIIPWDQLDVNYDQCMIWPETSELPSEAQFWFAVAWDCLVPVLHTLSALYHTSAWLRAASCVRAEACETSLLLSNDSNSRFRIIPAQQPAGWIWRTLVDSSLIHPNSGSLRFLHQAFRAGKKISKSIKTCRNKESSYISSEVSPGFPTPSIHVGQKRGSMASPQSCPGLSDDISRERPSSFAPPSPPSGPVLVDESIASASGQRNAADWTTLDPRRTMNSRYMKVKS